MADELRRCKLPDPWYFGVTRDGRVFFINDETRTTTWLHPRSEDPVCTGHRKRADLPLGWEEAFTREGVSYFINHNDGTTSFDHPLGEQAGDTAVLLLTNQISESSQPQQQQPPQQQQQFYHHQQQQQHQHHHHHQQQQSSTPPPVPRHQSHHYQQQQQHQQQHHLLHPHHYQQYQQHQHHHQQQQHQLGGGSGGGGGGEEEALLVVCDAAPARPVSVSSGSSATNAAAAAMSGHPAGGEHDGGGAPPSPVPKNAKGSRKLQNFGKRSHSIRRNPNAPVMIRGWLHKQDSTGMKLWKKRWFVLSDFCLFYYKDDKEEGVLGSISLPSFQVNPVEAGDKINRKFAFKAGPPSQRHEKPSGGGRHLTRVPWQARHAGMRTYYFGADSLEEMRVWMKAMAQASQLQMEIPQGDGGGGSSSLRDGADDKPASAVNHSRGRAAEEEEEAGGGQVLADGLRGAPALARWRPPRSDGGDDGNDEDERGGPRGDVEIVTEEGLARPRASTDDDDDAEVEAVTSFAGPSVATRADDDHDDVDDGGDDDSGVAAAEAAAEELRRQLHDGYDERGAAAEQRDDDDGDERFDPSAGPGRTPAEAADRPTAGAAISRPEAAATSCVVLRHPNPQQQQQQPRPQQRPLLQQQQQQLQRHSTGGLGLAGSSSLSALDQDGFGYGAAGGAGEGHRAVAAVALEREREREKRNSMVQLEQWMQSQKEKNEGDRLSIASTQTLPRSMPSYRQSLVVVGAPYPDGYTSLPRHAAAAASSSLSRRPPGGAAGPAVPYGAGGGAGGSAGGHGPSADVVSELFEWRQRQVLRHGGHSPAPPGASSALHRFAVSSPPTLYSMAEVDESDGAAYGAGGDAAGSYGVTRARSRSERSPGHRRSHAPAGRVDVAAAAPPAARHAALPLAGPHRQRGAEFSHGYGARGTQTLDRRPMPSMVYTSTPQSIPPSLQGRTPEELTLLLIQLRRNQAVLAEARDRTLAHLLGPAPAAPRSQVRHESLAPSLHLQRNLRFIESQMKANEPLINTVQTIICCRSLPFRPQFVFPESNYSLRSSGQDIDMKLTRLCDQNKTLHEQETRLRQLRNEKARIESSLEGLHLQIAQRRSQPELLHEQQQRLQADLVHIRADSARLSLDLERSVSEYKQLESDLLALRVHLEDLLSRLSFTQTEVGHQQRAQVQRDLWRIQDVMGGLGQGSWDVTTAGGAPVGSGVSGHPHLARDPSGSPPRAVGPHSPLRSSLRREATPPRPPLPDSYGSYGSARPALAGSSWGSPYAGGASGEQLTNGDAKVAHHQPQQGKSNGSSDRQQQQQQQKVFTSLVGVVPPLSQPGQMQSTTIASYVTLRRAKSNGAKERPKSAMDALYPAGGPAGGAGRGKMSVEEQLERLKLNQKAAAVAAGGGGGGGDAATTTVTPAGGSGRAAPRRRGHTMTLDRRTILAAQSPARPASVDVSQLMKVSQRKDDLDIAELERAVQDASAPETPAQEIARLRTAGTELDGSYDPGSEQVSPPRHHVMVPERYVDEDPEEPLSPLEMEARQKNVERIKAMLAKSSVQNVAPLPSPASREVAQGKVEAHVQEQERIISMSCALAAEACQRSKAVAAKLTSPTKGASPSQDASAPGGGSHFAFV
ncbi:pleckstrin homology domain-containing family A member 7-like isoform X3 [Lethenteron reissneri]|uniref:pleckstrin homology domain-containing family A member 7-like isoform X3 n=1 Tax=Lethenteron reissneri TaxID=7753 RepID=UPI002AB71D5B|nr:pleckstrin homology domain-containing family A member 7-like isoform X3 [Lethenteron reissneri]